MIESYSSGSHRTPADGIAGDSLDNAQGPLLSIVIPAFNEAESIVELFRQIQNALKTSLIHFEIVFVDDGSTDGTWREISELAQTEECVRAARLRVRTGKTAALTVGFEQSRGAKVITMDADLQDDPEEIPRLLVRMEEGYDVVCGWKRFRIDPWHKVWPSRCFNFLMKLATGIPIHDHNCGLKCFRRSVLEEIPLFGDLHRFTIMLAHRRGFRIGEIEIRHRARLHGESKYGVGRFVGGLLDILMVKAMTRFLERPFQCLGLIGAVSLIAGFGGLSYLAVLWVIGEGPIGNRPLMTYSAAALLFGVQLLTLGLLAEIIVWQQAGAKKQCHPIAEVIGGDEND